MTTTRRAHSWRAITRGPTGFASTIRGHQVTIYAEEINGIPRWFLEIRKDGELVRPRSEHDGGIGAMAAAEVALNEQAGDGSQPATGQGLETSHAENLYADNLEQKGRQP